MGTEEAKLLLCSQSLIKAIGAPRGCTTLCELLHIARRGDRFTKREVAHHRGSTRADRLCIRCTSCWPRQPAASTPLESCAPRLSRLPTSWTPLCCCWAGDDGRQI